MTRKSLHESIDQLTKKAEGADTLREAINKALDGLDSIAGDRTPEFFPETSYDCARRVASNVRSLLSTIGGAA